MDMDRSACIAEWQRVMGLAVPKYLSVYFMQKALAYEVQCKAQGGLPASAKRTLAAVANGREMEQAAPVAIRPGTHLVREWNGRTYQVVVGEDGYVLDGKTYKSLSAIARKITGARWSGPRFFGLTNRRSGFPVNDETSHLPQDIPQLADNPDKASIPTHSNLDALP